MKSKPIVVVVGSLNMDLVIEAESLPTKGQTVQGDGFRTTPGGKGANQAVAAARLGADVRMVGRVGDDIHGRELLASLTNDAIDVSGVSIDPRSPTGVALITVDKFGDNTIVADYGANTFCGGNELKLLKEAIVDADILLIQNEVPSGFNESVCALAESESLPVIWDPAPYKRGCDSLIPLVNILTPNVGEAELLTDLPISQSSNVENVYSLCEELLLNGASTPIITMGDQGAAYYSGMQAYHCKPIEVTQVDSVSAGDAFTGGLAVAMAEGLDIHASVRFGSIAGALAASRLGSQQSMAYRSEVDNILANGPSSQNGV